MRQPGKTTQHDHVGRMVIGQHTPGLADPAIDHGRRRLRLLKRTVHHENSHRRCRRIGLAGLLDPRRV
jgi:hypothetical protein